MPSTCNFIFFSNKKREKKKRYILFEREREREDNLGINEKEKKKKLIKNKKINPYIWEYMGHSHTNFLKLYIFSSLKKEELWGLHKDGDHSTIFNILILYNGLHWPLKIVTSTLKSSHKN